jgi:hypothetical protein
MAVRERLAVAVSAAREVPRLERELDDLLAHARSGTPYRSVSEDQITAVAERLDDAKRERAVRAKLRVQEAELLRARSPHVPLPILDDVSIASPCPASWDEMDGDGDVRFCGKCKKNVYNISMMSRDEAGAVVASARISGGACLRLYKRADGTLITNDCPVGVRRRFWRRKAGIAAAGLLFAIGMSAYMDLVYRARHTTIAGTAAAAGGF